MKIGVFDSGLGGLTVVQAMKGIIKGADIYYLADTRHAPYGEKSAEEIIRYSCNITDYFIKEHQIDVLVVACNTATTTAIGKLRERYPQLIIVGTEPGIKPAIEQTETGAVGILATPATLKSDKYLQLSQRLASDTKVTLIEQACPGLVEKIENNALHTEETDQMLAAWLAPMKEAQVDTIVLGCTHYPVAADKISALMDQRVSLIHTGEAIARRVLRMAEIKGHDNSGELSFIFYATGSVNADVVTQILGFTVPVEKIDKI
jgi:glutamate racemase